jgi:hypothetical protein
MIDSNNYKKVPISLGIYLISDKNLNIFKPFCFVFWNVRRNHFLCCNELPIVIYKKLIAN